MIRNVNEAVIAKARKEGKDFEILVDPQNAADFKAGKNISITDVVVSEEIYSDAKKGLRASEKDLEKLFGTDDKLEICKTIVKNGIVQITAEMLRKELEQTRKQVVNLVHRSTVDPNTGKPHPPQRIENAIAEAKIRVENKPAEQQVKDVIDGLKKILPIKYEIRELGIRVAPQYAGKSFNTLKHYGKLISERWENDGSLSVMLEIPAGLQEELEVDLNRLTKGTVEISILKKK
ncbi:MAG TPA: ribosome assembly factor SBDS [Candidatus Nanoarchaeia archaeon]|nr:ribosome assembly factor SBDS [Candidatus Nanoarchaeia archaeon]